jgi:hypothetical protein
VAIKKKVTTPTKKVAVTKGKEKTVVKEVEMPVNDVRELQDGIMPTNSKVKDKPPVGYATVGLNLGATLNMGDFQSARIDVFVQRNVVDTDEAIKDEFANLSELLQAEIQRQSALLDGDE